MAGYFPDPQVLFSLGTWTSGKSVRFSGSGTVLASTFARSYAEKLHVWIVLNVLLFIWVTSEINSLSRTKGLTGFGLSSR